MVIASLIIGAITFQTACSMLNNKPDDKNIVDKQDSDLYENEKKDEHSPSNSSDNKQPEQHIPSEEQKPAEETEKDKSREGDKPEPNPTEEKKGQGPGATNYDAIEVVAQPEAITVLVNKRNKLPDNYEPADLVYPDVPFIFAEKLDKRKMRAEAADALEKLFAGAASDGIYLAGVSGYRSKATQEVLYNNYVKKDGTEAADRYSARPGHSEHQTGLTMDISGSTGKCAAQDCFADTPEAAWLAEHAYKYGFIIRYPEGKEHITGYKYEPWHLRFVGTDIAKQIHEQGITFEEYYYEAIPVDGQR